MHPFLESYLLVATAALLLILLLGLVRVVRGPSRADRMLAAQLFSTVGLAVLVILAVLTPASAALNVALVLALLAPLTVIAFIKMCIGATGDQQV